MKKVRSFIPKQDPRIPHGWGIKVQYLDGSKDDELEGTHRFIEIFGEKWLEVVTIEDEVVLIAKEIIKTIRLDKRFSKAMEIKRDLERKAEEQRAKLTAATPPPQVAKK